LVGDAGILRDLTATPRNAQEAEAFFGSNKPSEVDSLPDVWSQVEGFADALYDRNHERHAPAVYQWRGLLACLGLAGEFLPDLYLRRIDLTSRQIFVATAALLPLRLPILMQGYRAGNTNHLTEIGIIHLNINEAPLGLLVPTTFVAPARSRLEALRAPGRTIGASWLTETSIEDPTRHPQAVARLGRAHYELLTRYIERLFVRVAGGEHVSQLAGRRVSQEPGLAQLDAVRGRRPHEGTRDRVHALGRLLEEYWNDCKAAALVAAGRGNSHDVRYQFTRALRPTHTSFNDPLHGPAMLQAVETVHRQRDDRPPSRTRIQTRPNCTLTNVILADPDMAFDAPENIVILDQTTVVHLREQRDSIPQRQTAAAQENILLVTPDDLFTDTLIEIANGLLPSHGGQPTDGNEAPLFDYVLPLSPLALMLFDDLVGEHARLRLIRQGPDEAQAILSIPLLAGRSEQEVIHHEIKKTYRVRGHEPSMGLLVRANNAENSNGRLDALALWPNLDDLIWRDFQIYSFARVTSEQGERSILPLWPINGHTLAQSVQHDNRPGQPTAASRALSLARTWSEIKAYDRAQSLVREVVVSAASRDAVTDARRLQVRRRPEAYMVAAASRSLLEHGVDQLKIAGLIMVPAAPRPNMASTARLEVGLDFGSSNTTVYVKQPSDSKPDRLTLAQRRLDLVTDREGRPPVLGQLDFAPIQDRPFPISSLLDEHGQDEHGRSLDEQQDAQYVLGSIGSVAVILNLNDSLPRAQANNLTFNIKWLNDGVRASSYYLQHLILMILAEAADKGVNLAMPDALTWRISYPSAYSGNHYRRFIKGIASMLKRVSPGDGSQQPIHIRPVTESVCTARYFRAIGKGARSGTTIILDIGGGTSDIAVWQQSNTAAPLIWQSSIRFAGQQLVVEPIARNLLQEGSTAEGTGRGTGSILGTLAELQVPAQDDDIRRDFIGALVRLRDSVGTRVPNGQATEKWLNHVGMVINSPHFAAHLSDAFAHFDTDGSVGRTLDVIALGFAGLLWFVGRQLRRMAASGQGDDSVRDERSFNRDLNGIVSVCLAGRPSQMIRALIEEREGFEQAFAKILIAAAELAPETRVMFDYSENSKEEVAYGLLAPGLGDDAEAVAYHTILGEAVIGPNNRKLDAHEFLPPGRGKRPLQIDETAPEMSAFIKCITQMKTGGRGERFLAVPDLAKALPLLVNEANNAIGGAFDAELQSDGPMSPDDETDDVEDGYRPLTMEVQPPFFALLRQVMQHIQQPRLRLRRSGGHRV
jgi:hypothetical protein